jgi:hypothetical protein
MKTKKLPMKLLQILMQKRKATARINPSLGVGNRVDSYQTDCWPG